MMSMKHLLMHKPEPDDIVVYLSNHLYLEFTWCATAHAVDYYHQDIHNHYGEWHLPELSELLTEVGKGRDVDSLLLTPPDIDSDDPEYMMSLEQIEDLAKATIESIYPVLPKYIYRIKAIYLLSSQNQIMVVAKQQHYLL